MTLVEEPSMSVSATARLMLFGDFAVYFGESAVAVAVELRARCHASLSQKFIVDNEELDPRKHRRVRGALLQAWTDMDRPLKFVTHNEIRGGWGLGESVARTVSCLGAVSMIHDHIILEEVAQNAFAIEKELVEGLSPLDVSVSTYGDGMALMKDSAERGLWKIADDEGRRLHHLRTLDWTFVVGKVDQNVGPGQMYGKLKRFYKGNAFARDIVKEIGSIAVEAEKTLRARDIVRVGGLMNENQKALVTLGITHPGIEKVMKAVGRHSYGVKLTGDQSGVCICALTDRPELVTESFADMGAQVEVLSIAKEGLRLDDEGRFRIT